MDVSVVVPTYNEEKYLPLMLQSLIPQLKAGDEVIIVDNASTDRTLEIASAYGCRIFVWKGSSIGQARDFGVSQAGNEVVLQCDADLVFSENFFNKLKKHYEAHPEVVGVTGGWRDAKGRILGNFTCAVLENLLHYADCLVSYRREVYYRTSGHPNTGFGEQILLWNQMSRLGPTIYDASMTVHHFSDAQVRIPSYLLSAGLAGLGLASGPTTRIGAAFLGTGLGVAAGQVGADHCSYLANPGRHIHHFHVGGLIVAATMTFHELLSPTWESALLGVGLGLILHDWLSEPAAFSNHFF